MPASQTVYIVDDDAAVRDALGLLLSLHGYRTAFFSDAASFLRTWTLDARGCLLLDIRMPGMDGLALQQALLDLGSRLPVLVITGHGDVHSARAAFRSQAVDFLEKPLQERQLVAAIEEAFARDQGQASDGEAAEQYRRREASLTPREREVMELVVAGRHNRDIAHELGISVRTVEVHKSRVMEKLAVDSIADLVRQHLQQPGRRAPGS
ncbi:response regulator transcription factor [Massilia yuzhufengensis]|uniref:Two component transcriptional regulator, LuxR family n=1 Tax=Massilia yuzhufengensis TaxID=1164594 RepID=A0A1I1QQB0_9BURK|nr:response regulator [Massilia yuzhufengensis]SFD22038.1 two component transcriptional regulator, LuxR family [Massilia yuzhufengensis]